MTEQRNDALASVVELLDLRKIDDTTFEGPRENTTGSRIFGGQVVSQGLMAASETVDGRPAISLKSDFLRAGDATQSVVYHVEKVRDGRSFSTRRVSATQRNNGAEKVIFTLSANFQEPEVGVSHQLDMDVFPPPAELADSAENWANVEGSVHEILRQWYATDRGFEERPVNFIDPLSTEKRPPYHPVWHKSRGRVNGNNALHQSLFGYVSDMCLLDPCLLPHGVSWVNNVADALSLDHSIWFHREFRVDEWMLFVCESPVSSGARGFNRASVYRENGDLIASVVQEGLIRLR